MDMMKSLNMPMLACLESETLWVFVHCRHAIKDAHGGKSKGVGAEGVHWEYLKFLVEMVMVVAPVLMFSFLLLFLGLVASIFCIAVAIICFNPFNRFFSVKLILLMILEALRRGSICQSKLLKMLRHHIYWKEINVQKYFSSSCSLKLNIWTFTKTVDNR